MWDSGNLAFECPCSLLLAEELSENAGALPREFSECGLQYDETGPGHRERFYVNRLAEDLHARRPGPPSN